MVKTTKSKTLKKKSKLPVLRRHRTNILIGVFVALLLAVAGVYIVSRSQASSGARKSVQVIRFCPASGCNVATQAQVQGWSNQVASWYKRQVGADYTNLPVKTITGSKATSYYSTCRKPEGCSSTTDAIVANLRSDYPSSSSVANVYVLGYTTPEGPSGNCGVTLGSNSQLRTAVVHTQAQCSSKVALALAHEIGHTMGLGHIGTKTIMNSSILTCSQLESCGLEKSQKVWLAFNSPMYTLPTATTGSGVLSGTFSSGTAGFSSNTGSTKPTPPPVAESRIYGYNRFFGPQTPPKTVPYINVGGIGIASYNAISWTSANLSSRDNWTVKVASKTFDTWKLDSICYIGTNYTKCVENTDSISVVLNDAHPSVFMVFNWSQKLPLGANIKVTGNVMVDGAPAANELVANCYNDQKTRTDANGNYSFNVPANANYCVRLQRDKKLYSVKATNSPKHFSSYEYQIAKQNCAVTTLCPSDAFKVWDKSTDTELNFMVSTNSPTGPARGEAPTDHVE